jgi:hypothetical protein
MTFLLGVKVENITDIVKTMKVANEVVDVVSKTDTTQEAIKDAMEFFIDTYEELTNPTQLIEDHVTPTDMITNNAD